MTDYWTTQTGRIWDVLTIPCTAGGAITEGSSVKFGTSAADAITVIASAAAGDGQGIALKAASASGDVIPVLFIGVFKCTVDTGVSAPAIVAKDYIMNSITTTVAERTSGTYLGQALQDSSADADKILVLIGRYIG